MAIEPSRLPLTAVLDTGVVIRALDRQRKDAVARACQAFWDAMIRAYNHMLIPAPVLAEILRGDRAATPVPRNRYVEVVAFDAVAAEKLGTHLPLVKAKAGLAPSAPPGTVNCLKFDSMIVACALRYNVRTVVSIDRDIPRIARLVGITPARPESFEDPQGRLITEDGAELAP